MYDVNIIWEANEYIKEHDNGFSSNDRFGFCAVPMAQLKNMVVENMTNPEPKDYFAIRNIDLLHKQIFYLFNTPFNSDLDIGWVHGISDLDLTDNCVEFRQAGFSRRTYNRYDYAKITETLFSKFCQNIQKTDQFLSTNIVAFHFEYKFTGIPTKETVINTLSYLSNIKFKNFIMLANYTYFFNSIHIIVSNASCNKTTIEKYSEGKCKRYFNKIGGNMELYRNLDKRLYDINEILKYTK